MEIALINYINNYPALQNLIGENRMFPLFATDITSPALEFTYRELSGAVLKQSQLSINILWTHYDKILEIKNLLREILDFELADYFMSYHGFFFNSQLSGSSSPIYRPDIQLFQVNLNFIIKWRKINANS